MLCSYQDCGYSITCSNLFFPTIDMGCGEQDDAFFIKEDIQPDSMNTTSMIYNDYMDDLSFVFHIGDMSYARGFSAVVSGQPRLTACKHYHSSTIIHAPSI